jgi:hypothetical protein
MKWNTLALAQTIHDYSYQHYSQKKKEAKRKTMIT